MTVALNNLIKNENLDKNVCLLDLIKCKPFPDISDILNKFKRLLIIDEQTPCGGISSAVLEFLCDNKIKIDIDRLTLPDRHFFENGGRDFILSKAGLENTTYLKKFKVF